MLKIEIEGIDGSGKTTGFNFLVKYLKSLGLNVISTREVGNPNVPACVGLREFVLNQDNKLSGEAMELIFVAMRFENEKWLQSLPKDFPPIVVSDRGWLSHLAYTDHNVSEDFTTKFYSNFVEEFTSLPDVVIYFDIDIDTALSRRVQRGEKMDAIEAKGTDFQEKVRRSFEKYLPSVPKYYRIDASKSIEDVKLQLADVISSMESEGYFA